jgi:membrane protease YdiL (CAAX protease family)
MPWTLASAHWTQTTPDQAAAAFVLGLATLAWMAYHFAISPAFVRRLHPDATTADALSTATAWHRKLIGGPLFAATALACGVAFDLPLGLTHDELGTSLLWTVGALLVVAPIVWLQAKKPSFRSHYPEVRTPFTNHTRLTNAAAWLAFLFGYELFFRGLLVLGLASLIGPLPALAASMVAYVITHLHKYPGEAFGSIATGLLFAGVALETGSLVMPVALHTLIAVTSDELAARAARAAGP